MAFAPAWGGTIPLVKHDAEGGRRDERRRNRRIGFVKTRIAVITAPSRGVALAGWKLFLATAVGATVYAEFQGILKGMVARTASPEELYREIQEFLRSQRTAQPGGRPPKGLGIPVVPASRHDRGVERPGKDVKPHDIRDGYERLFEPISTGKDEPGDHDNDEPKRRVRRWLERRYRLSPTPQRLKRRGKGGGRFGNR